MASTVVNIPGVAPITIPFKMTDINQIKAYLSGEHPQIGNMENSQSISGENVTVTFSQKTGTKG